MTKPIPLGFGEIWASSGPGERVYLMTVAKTNERLRRETDGSISTTIFWEVVYIDGTRLYAGSNAASFGTHSGWELIER